MIAVGSTGIGSPFPRKDASGMLEVPEVPVQRPFASIESAIEAIRAGHMVVVVDDEDRENEGDLTLAAAHATPEAIAFMATHGRGLICTALEGDVLDRLHIPMMVRDNTSPFETAFCVSVEAREGTSTGISAQDRARTIQALINPEAKPWDFVKPGHTFPLRARAGGVLSRTGQTEASVDLARLAGLHPSGVICEIMKDDGTMARVPDLVPFCEQHGLLMITVADLVAYRLQREPLIRACGQETAQTSWGPLTVHRFESVLDGSIHLAFSHGMPTNAIPLVRVHLESLPEDLLGFSNPQGTPFHQAMNALTQAPSGVLVYLRRGNEARSVGSPTNHEIGVGAQILRHLGVRSMRLLSHVPKKYVGLKGFGLDIVEHIHMDKR